MRACHLRLGGGGNKGLIVPLGGRHSDSELCSPVTERQGKSSLAQRRWKLVHGLLSAGYCSRTCLVSQEHGSVKVL